MYKKPTNFHQRLNQQKDTTELECNNSILRCLRQLENLGLIAKNQILVQTDFDSDINNSINGHRPPDTKLTNLENNREFFYEFKQYIRMPNNVSVCLPENLFRRYAYFGDNLVMIFSDFENVFYTGEKLDFTNSQTKALYPHGGTLKILNGILRNDIKCKLQGCENESQYQFNVRKMFNLANINPIVLLYLMGKINSVTEGFELFLKNQKRDLDYMFALKIETIYSYLGV